jgi:hypothetical protein
MDFFDRLALHTEAVGVENVAVAWDLANTPLSDEQHFEVASLFGGWR